MSTFWDESLVYLKGIGPKRAALLEAELSLRTFGDLLEYLPRGYSDRRERTPIGYLSPSQGPVSVLGTLQKYVLQETTNGRQLLTAVLKDETGSMELRWFRSFRWIPERIPAGSRIKAYGKPVFFHGKAQLVHPEMEQLTPNAPFEGRMEPQYSTTEALVRVGLDSRGIARASAELLRLGGATIPETLPQSLIKIHNLIPRGEALRELHQPSDPDLLARARHRIKFEELLLFQLALGQHRRHVLALRPSHPFTTIGEGFNRFYSEVLPFPLTGAQKRVLREIRQDVARPVQMNRLIQGDVGAGKTVVALLAMFMALDNGFQSALMAPTEILAEQHHRILQRMVEPLGIRVGILTGSVTGQSRRDLLSGVANGEISFLVGTHALLEDPVRFERLGLTIVDEQHKFGVRQRGRLWAKTAPFYPHNLLMTATPIPRTLALTAYGEVDISVIDELPPGRQPIDTHLFSPSQRLLLFGEIKRKLAQGAQVYVVFPLVSESAQSDLLAAETGYEAYRRALPGIRLGIVHGQMAPEAKAYEMATFVRGQTQVLIATTVIEVGVDVPSARVMVIENAERFGLSQLHQLRGRVGRGSDQSFCYLMTGKRLGKIARDRLQILVETSDGFVIAQRDLQLRGPGDFLGTRQSGLPSFQLADLVEDQALVEASRKAASALLDADPQLHQAHHLELATHLAHYRRQHHREMLTA